MSVARSSWRTALVVSICFCFAPALPLPAARADGSAYADATLITSAQFLKELKEVSLTLNADSWFKDYISEDDLRADVTKGLSQSGISVRSYAPVSLLVTMEELPAKITQTTIYTNGRASSEDYRTHLFYFEMAFFVRGTALRGDRFHLLNAAATRTSYVFTIEENNAIRAMFFGDENKKQLKEWIDRVIPRALGDIAARTTEDQTPWAASGWSEQQKEAGNKAYALFMDSKPKVEKNPIEGLDVVPDLQLSSDINAEGCREDPMWKKFWQGEFQQFGWVRAEGHPSVTLFHGFACRLAAKNQFAFPDYYRLSDEASLVEANVVFELNGRLVRKPAVIFQTHRTKVAVEADLSAVFQGYTPRSIQEFVANLKLSDQLLPNEAGSTNPMLKETALGMKFVRIEPGTFTMGSPETEEGHAGNETQHRVTLTKPYYMATKAVTRGQFRAFVDESGYKTEAEKASEISTWKYNVDFEQEDTQPVVDVTWNDAVAFTEWLSRKEHKTFRLPTEAEWEYACRAGTTTAFNTGATLSSDAADVDGSGASGVNRRKTTPVGSFPANRWGLYDMHGNAWQWCSDVYGDYSPDAVTDPTGPAPASGSARVLRGGSYHYGPAICRSAYRYWNPPEIRYNDVGFRVVSDAP